MNQFLTTCFQPLGRLVQIPNRETIFNDISKMLLQLYWFQVEQTDGFEQSWRNNKLLSMHPLNDVFL